MAHIVSDTGVAIIASLDGETEEVVSIQRVKGTVYIDVHENITDAKNGHNMIASVQIATDDLIAVLPKLGLC